MLKLKARGPWYHVEGKNSLGVIIKRHAIGIAVYDRQGRIDKLTKQAAEAKVLELEKVKAWPIKPVEVPAEPKTITLIDAYTLWINQEKYLNRPSTRAAYVSVEKVLVEPLTAQGVVFVKDVTSEQLRVLQEDWDAHQMLSVVKNWRTYTSILFNHCVKYHGLLKNPWDAG